MIRSKPSTDKFRKGYDSIKWCHDAGVVQKVERVPCKHIVESSILSAGSMIIKCQDEDLILNG